MKKIILPLAIAACTLAAHFAPAAPSADAADALACAICHAHGGEGLGALKRSGYRMRRGRIL